MCSVLCRPNGFTKLYVLFSSVVLFLSLVELEATSAIGSSCPIRNLSVCVDDFLRLYIDGIEITDLPNADIFNLPDVVDLPCTTRLIAIHGRNGDSVTDALIVASTGDDYVLTNSTWKCSNVSQFGWEEVDFDDAAWVPAIEYGHNGNSNFPYLPGVSTNAAFIWLRTNTAPEMDVDVYCRKRLCKTTLLYLYHSR